MWRNKRTRVNYFVKTVITLYAVFVSVNICCLKIVIKIISHCNKL